VVSSEGRRVRDHDGWCRRRTCCRIPTAGSAAVGWRGRTRLIGESANGS